MGINQSREDNIQFKMDVTKKLEDITLQQLRFEKSLSSISKDLNEEKQSIDSRMELA